MYIDVVDVDQKQLSPASITPFLPQCRLLKMSSTTISGALFFFSPVWKWSAMTVSYVGWWIRILPVRCVVLLRGRNNSQQVKMAGNWRHTLCKRRGLIDVPKLPLVMPFFRFIFLLDNRDTTGFTESNITKDDFALTVIYLLYCWIWRGNWRGDHTGSSFLKISPRCSWCRYYL